MKENTSNIWNHFFGEKLQDSNITSSFIQIQDKLSNEMVNGIDNKHFACRKFNQIDYISISFQWGFPQIKIAKWYNKK